MMRLTVEPLDLGPEIRAVQLELAEAESEAPPEGDEAVTVWVRALGALAGDQPWVMDFFAHPDRVEEFCRSNDVEYRKTAAGGIVVGEKQERALARLFARFRGETFGARAGAPLELGDAELDRELRRFGLDAYHQAYPRYRFCAICELETGSVTIVSDSLGTAEVSRQLRLALKEFPVSVELPA